MESKLVLDNDIQQIPQLAEFIDGIAEQAGLDMSVSMSLNLAMEEAVSNVMLYAYPQGSKRQVQIDATVQDGTIKFVISDSGIPFDPTAKKDANIDLSVEDRPIGGLGIYMVKQIMDTVNYEYKDGKNILTLTKSIK